MNKIAVLSIFHENYNYGGLLQAYALCEFLNSLGYESKQIDYVSHREEKRASEKTIFFIHHPILLMNKIKCKVSNILYKDRADNTLDLFKEFIDLIPHTDPYDLASFETINKYFDAFVVGSDQVWNIDFCDDAYLLKNINDKPKIAIAASAGKNELTKDEISRIQSSIDGFFAVSVREKSLKIQLNSSNKEIDVILDPVFLFDKFYWEELSVDLPVTDRYIFCYMLGSNSEVVKDISKLAKEMKMKTVMIDSKTSSNNRDYADLLVKNVGPKEFLGLIKNAEFILTDSFHGTAFSIIFEKNFYSFNRAGFLKEMNSRIRDLLETFELDDRYITATDLHRLELKDIDYNNIRNIIENSVKYSQHWITSNMREML